MRRLAFAILLAGCFEEPNYEGRFCEAMSPCPSGFRCVDGTCTSRPPLPLDSGLPEDPDAGDVDSGGADVPAIDTGAEDAGTPDAGDPNLARCYDPIAYPSSGWEARHFSLGAGFSFTSCFGVEDVAGDGIDRDYRGTGPFDGTIVDFGSRYTATRNFEEGIHTFTFTHDDGLRVRIDGVLIYELWAHGYSADVRVYSPYLTAGPHLIELEHFDDSGWAQIAVSWQRGCGTLEVPSNSWIVSYHGYDAATGELNLAQCYGFETLPASFLSITSAPPNVAAQGATVYGIVGRGRHDFRGMTVVSFDFADGLRADINGERVVDRWGTGSPTSLAVQDYLPVLADIRFEKLSTLGQDSFSIAWNNVCDLMPSIGPAEWWARYYRILYTANPESWTIDRSDCLGAQLISSNMLMQSGEPPPIAALGLVQLWGAEFFGTRSFGANTNVSVTYDDGVRIFDGGNLVYEDWYGPQVETASFVYAAGTHAIRLEYFQNNGGTQIRFTW